MAWPTHRIIRRMLNSLCPITLLTGLYRTVCQLRPTQCLTRIEITCPCSTPTVRLLEPRVTVLTMEERQFRQIWPTIYTLNIKPTWPIPTVYPSPTCWPISRCKDQSNDDDFSLNPLYWFTKWKLKIWRYLYFCSWDVKKWKLTDFLTYLQL